MGEFFRRFEGNKAIALELRQAKVLLSDRVKIISLLLPLIL